MKTCKTCNSCPVITDFRDKFLCGDSLAVMKSMPDESVDLVVTSPPYNLKNSTGNGMKDGRGGKWSNASLMNGYSHHNDCMPHEEYATWQKDCLTEMFRLIKNDGAIFYNHKWRVQAGLLQDRQDIVSGFPVRQIIIWRRKGGINFNKGYFLPTYEVIYLICKPDFELAKGANSHGDVWEFTQEMKNEHPAPFPAPQRVQSTDFTSATRRKMKCPTLLLSDCSSTRNQKPRRAMECPLSSPSKCSQSYQHLACSIGSTRIGAARLR